MAYLGFELRNTESAVKVLPAVLWSQATKLGLPAVLWSLITTLGLSRPIPIFTLNIRTSKLLIVIVTSQTWTGQSDYLLVCPTMAGWMANSANPDQIWFGSTLFTKACLSQFLWGCHILTFEPDVSKNVSMKKNFRNLGVCHIQYA